MKISKKTLVILIVAILAVLGIVALLISAPKDTTNQAGVNNEGDAKCPTFMYFVTNDDLTNEDTASVIEKLKDKYSDSVVFEIKNVDEDESLLENFSIVTGKTPALIMLDRAGDIARIEFETNNYGELKDVIDDTIKK